jgi:uncharacterized membrane protein
MNEQASAALLTDPMALFAYLAGVLGLIFWLGGLPRLRRLFDITPPVLYAYFIPTLSTTFGVIPPASPVYDWMTRYLLPVALLLLMITVDVPAILKLGRIALLMMLAGTLGIVLGGPVAFLIFGQWLPPESWKGLAALSGSWIGGTANLVAIAESVGTPDSIMGPIIVVDTVVGYGWMAVLLFLSAWQGRYDRAIGARTEALEATNQRLAEMAANRRPTDIRDAAVILGLGFAGAVLAVAAGARLPKVGDPTIISNTTWTVLMVVTGGLLLSFTPVRKLEEVGASRLGYLALYLLLTGIGAQADLRAVLSAPVFFAAGVVWLLVHMIVLFGVGRLLRAPLFFVATGSMANVGGAASAPMGLLMAVAGYILGIYGGLGCAWILGQMAGG